MQSYWNCRLIFLSLANSAECHPDHSLTLPDVMLPLSLSPTLNLTVQLFVQERRGTDGETTAAAQRIGTWRDCTCEPASRVSDLYWLEGKNCLCHGQLRSIVNSSWSWVRPIVLIKRSEADPGLVHQSQALLLLGAFGRMRADALRRTGVIYGSNINRYKLEINMKHFYWVWAVSPQTWIWYQLLLLII